MSEFEQAIADNVRKAIGKAKRQGTVGMSAGNLLQVTPTPRYGLQGEVATPAAYASVFERIARGVKVRGFQVY